MLNEKPSNIPGCPITSPSMLRHCVHAHRHTPLPCIPYIRAHCKTLLLCLQTGSISVGSYGDVTLLTNSATAVTLTAAPLSGCGTTTAISGTTTVYPNLNPVELDVDAGEAFGLQVQSQTAEVATPAALQVGSTFDMDIRVNSTSSPLIAFEVSPQWLGGTAVGRLCACSVCEVPAGCALSIMHSTTRA